MKFLKVLAILFFYSISTSAQSEYEMRIAAQNIKTTAGQDLVGSWIPPKPKNNYIKGSQYLFDSWNGLYTVISKTGGKCQLLNLNYNISSKKLESLIANDSVFQYDLDQFDYIVKFDKKYKVINNDNNEGLFLELFNNKVCFYKEVQVSIEEGTLNPLTQELISDSKYLKKYIYYILVNDTLKKIKLNKTDLLKCLSDKEALIKVFVKENKLSYNSEEDFLKILNYYITIK